MKRLFLTSVCLALLLVARSSPGAAVPVVLVQDDQAKATIVLTKQPGMATEALGLENEDFKQRERLLETRPGTLILMGRDAAQSGEFDYEGDLSAFAFLSHKLHGSCHAVHTFLEKHLRSLEKTTRAPY